MKTYFVDRYENGQKTRFMNQTEEQARYWAYIGKQYESVVIKIYDYDTFELVEF